MPTITYTPRTKLRERHVFYGGPGAGKSSACASIMLHTPHVSHYIVDAEQDNYERLFYEDPTYTSLLDRIDDTIHITGVDSTDWEEQLEVALKTLAQAQRGDFWYYDMMTDTWEAVRSWYTDKIYGADYADYFMDQRLDLERRREAAPNKKARDQAEMQGLSGWEDYSVINPQYKKLYKAIMNTEAHVVIVAEQDKLRKDSGKAGETKETKEAFGEIGFKPKGQKKLGHIPHSVTHFSTHAKDGRIATCAKDRGREYLWEEQFGEEKEGAFGIDFAKWYFPKIARWKAGIVK